MRHSRAAGGQRAPFEALLPSDDLFVDPIVKTDVLPAPGRARSTVRARVANELMTTLPAREPKFRIAGGKQRHLKRCRPSTIFR